jgi:hypothetical protein
MDPLPLLDSVAPNNPVRNSAFLVSNLMETWLGMGLTPNPGNDRFRLTGIKLSSDGSNQGLTGYQREPNLNSTSRASGNPTAARRTRVSRPMRNGMIPGSRVRDRSPG